MYLYVNISKAMLIMRHQSTFFLLYTTSDAIRTIQPGEFRQTRPSCKQNPPLANTNLCIEKIFYSPNLPSRGMGDIRHPLPVTVYQI